MNSTIEVLLVAEDENIDVIHINPKNRVLEFILVIVNSLFMAFLVNQLSGIIDSIGRNQFSYDALYIGNSDSREFSPDTTSYKS